MRLILNPGGCAVYQLPVEIDQKFAIIHPARKDGDPWPNYCPKASVNVTITASDLQEDFTCFHEADNCDSTACVGNFESVMSKMQVTEIQMSLCVAATDPNTAAIWEINISQVVNLQIISSCVLYCVSTYFRQMIPAKLKEFSWRVLKRDFSLLKLSLTLISSSVLSQLLAKEELENLL